MKLSSLSFRHQGVIPGRCAFAVRAPGQHVRLSQNLSPQLSWSGAPAGTRSYVLLCIDTDVPTRPDDVNQPDREVPFDLGPPVWVDDPHFDLDDHLHSTALPARTILVCMLQ